jgi:hypothetical protein
MVYTANSEERKFEVYGIRRGSFSEDIREYSGATRSEVIKKAANDFSEIRQIRELRSKQNL